MEKYLTLQETLRNLYEQGYIKKYIYTTEDYCNLVDNVADMFLERIFHEGWGWI